jgi:hypothetical protein
MGTRGVGFGIAVAAWLCIAVLPCGSAFGVEKAVDGKIIQFVQGTTTEDIPLLFDWDSSAISIFTAPPTATVTRIDIQIQGYCDFGDLLDFYLKDETGANSYHIDTSGWYDEGILNEVITNISGLNGLPVNQHWTLWGTSNANSTGEYVDVWRIWVYYDDGQASAVDLVAGSSSCTPLTVTKTDPLALAATVTNQGNILCGGFQATWYVSTNPTPSTSDTALYSWTITSLGAGEPIDSNHTVPSPALPGTYYVALMVDSANAVAESNEGNNWGQVFTLNVQDRDSDGDGVPDAQDAFPYNPCGATDSDGDGIGDEWEIGWFGSLNIADATSDFDHDGISDLMEFTYCSSLNLDPTQPEQLPIDGVGCGAILSAALLMAFAIRARRVAYFLTGWSD